MSSVSTQFLICKDDYYHRENSIRNGVTSSERWIVYKYVPVLNTFAADKKELRRGWLAAQESKLSDLVSKERLLQEEPSVPFSYWQ
uniref:Bm701 n=1 Tax=Brugia malayi TaxID=6279 RepID=A0A1I9G540_BRUMA|nr:Bm701 [Brugia malayi]